MFVMPAICQACGHVWPSGFVIRDSKNIMYEGCTVQPCPSCKTGVGRVPDGVYSSFGSVLEIVSAPEHSREDLARFVRLMKAFRSGEATREEVAAAIEKEAPAFNKLSDLLPHNRQDLYEFIQMIATILGLILGGITINNISVEQVINQQFNFHAPAQPAPPPRAVPHLQQVSRNAPCPCGSGKQYKKCCGVLK